MTEKKARNQGKPHIENQVLERNRGPGEKGERGPEPYIETRKLQAQGARVLDGMCHSSVTVNQGMGRLAKKPSSVAALSSCFAQKACCLLATQLHSSAREIRNSVPNPPEWPKF